ncbi:MAG TPA: hypothetical protein VE616_18920, partial [Candidatus Udaeobacter sp.]|nr:hypothetical protein [Candidatus Udaeobacter sp.]
MESNRRICSERCSVENGVVIKLPATNSSSRDKHNGRSRRAALVGRLFLSLSFFCAAVPVSAQTEKTEEEIKRPEYGIEYKVKRPLYQTGSAGRFNEDWSALRGVDLSKTDDFWDRLKFIPFNQDGSIYLTLGGQIRERLEYFNQFQFGQSAPERTDVFLASRFRWNADLHITPHFRLFAEGKSSL